MKNSLNNGLQMRYIGAERIQGAIYLLNLTYNIIKSQKLKAA